MPPEPLVYIILVNWNGRAVTLDCLASLRKSTYPHKKILVVDNASSDGSADAIRATFPEAEVLQTGANLRFAGGNNAGIRRALEEGADMVLLLNNDTTVEEDFLEPLVRRLASDPLAGAAGPRIVYHDDPSRIWYAGGRINFWTGTASHRGIREPDGAPFDTPGETDYATGCCLITRREVLERVGLLDTSYFMYAEDADWCLRARRAGYRIQYEPASRIRHKVSVSSGGHLSFFKIRHKALSTFRFFARHARWYHWPVFPWLSVLVNAWAGARYLAQAALRPALRTHPSAR
ncbi:MAG: glycosyltransferase family 2 protein [Bacteroidota bacterium]